MTQFQIQFKADGRWVLWEQFDSEAHARHNWDNLKRKARPWRLVKVTTEVLEEKGG